MAVLEARHLNVSIPTEDGVIHAVRDVSFSVEAGEFFGIVGESGSGKSVMVQAIMGLIPQAPRSPARCSSTAATCSPCRRPSCAPSAAPRSA